MTTTDVGGWAPAPGSVARQSWPASVRWAWWLLHRPALCAALAALAAVAVTAGAAAAVVLVGVTAAVLVGWWLGHPASFHPTAGRVLLGIWRSAWAYGVRWRTAMMLSGLGGRFDGGEFLPRVVRVRAGRYFDRVRVRIVAGQQPEDWARRADALAHAFGARSCQVTALAGRPGCVELAIGRRDPLAAVVPALPVSETVDLDGVPVGVTEAGERWRLSVAGGAHTLLAGCTGSGKGSVVWSLLRGLAPAIRDGWVQVWGADPKGGMELAPGAGLFTRLAWQPEAMVTLLEDAADLMLARSDDLRGRARVHVPTPDAPAVVVVVDELAKLTAYEPDPALRRRATQALSVLLTQGRAPAVTVVAALQDSRKDVVGFRSLFPVRVALRLVEADETRQVLGPGVHDRGAVCERIPASLPGVGYVVLDGQQTPTRVRAAWVTDDDIATMASDYTPRRSGAAGQVVDLPPVEDGDDEAGAA